MPSYLGIDPKLIDKALKVSGERTKKAVIAKALEEFVARHQQKGILDLVGKFDWNPDYDYKRERSRDHKLRFKP
ncbi:MAG TPA: type II toxin-antitoxin system VapB family antitoxin [Rhizomicrobium sp.]|jgi:hypothetical protein|nr:type II toxin-antitoxin system VapB family antitoxin [Rhizomicrobium sp.]